MATYSGSPYLYSSDAKITKTPVFVTVGFTVSSTPLVNPCPTPWEDDHIMSVLERKLKNEYPDATFIHNNFHLPGNNGNNFWNPFLASGRSLESSADKVIGDDPESSFVILCHGLGGILALQYFNSISILEHTAAFVFFGTPANTSQKSPEFTNAFRRCAFIECGLSIDAGAENVQKKCNDILESFAGTDKCMILVHETERCSHTKSKWRKCVVNQKMASFPGSHLSNTRAISSKTEHCTMSKMDLREVIGEIQNSVQAHRISPSPKTKKRLPISQRSASPIVSTTGNSHSRSTSTLAASLILPEAGARARFPAFRHVQYPKDPDFLGRTTILNDISKCLCDRAMLPRQHVALKGLPGMGKTQIARQFVEKASSHFDYILWVDAASNATIMSDYATFAIKLGKADRGINMSTAAQMLKDWFNECSESCLIVYDNANDIDVTRRWWPDGKNASVLATTNDTRFGVDANVIHPITVGKLGAEEATDMVLQQIPPESLMDNEETNKKEAQKLIDNVHGMALAVRLVIYLIKLSGMNLSDFNRHYPDEDHVFQPIREQKSQSVYIKYGKTVQSAFSQVLEKLKDDERKLMDVVSLLHASRIPKTLFDDKNFPAHLRNIPFLKNYGTYQFNFITNFLRRGDGDDKDNFELHGFMSLVIRDLMTKDAQRDAFHMATSLMVWAMQRPDGKQKSREARDLKLFKVFNSHIDAINKFYDETWTSGDNKDTIPASYILLLGCSSWLYYSNGFFRDCLKHIDTAQDLLDGLHNERITFHSPPTHETILEARLRIAHSQACIATEMGSFKLSLNRFTEENKIFEEARRNKIRQFGGPGRRNLILGGIANSHQGLGYHDKAIEFYSQCLTGTKEELLFASPFKVNICRSFMALGKLDEAEKRLQKLVQERERLYGPDDDMDYIAGHQKYILGNVRIQQQRYEEAFQLHQKALSNWQVTKGVSHHKTGDAWHKIGWHRVRQSEWADAKTAFETALKIYKSATSYGSKEYLHNGEIARTSYHLSLVLRHQGKLDEADKIKDEAMKFYAIRVSELEDELRGEEGTRDMEFTGDKGGSLIEPTEKDFEEIVSLWVR